MQLSLRQRVAGGFRLVREGIGNTIAPSPRECTFASGDRTIPAWLYRAKSPGPGALLLHTAGGLSAHERALARRLAQGGFPTMVVSYAPRTTGTALLADIPRRQSIEDATARSLEHLRAQPEVVGSDVAVIGLSLGGYFAVRLAASKAPPEAAVVFYGMYPDAAALMPSLSAPLLLLQGGRDEPAFVHAAEAAATLATAHGRSCELITYPEAVHQFDLFQASGWPATDAWSRTRAFLARHLRAAGAAR